MEVNYFLFLSFLFTLFCSIVSDTIVDDSDSFTINDAEKADLLSRYFEIEGISIDKSNTELLNSYSQNVLKQMQIVLNASSMDRYFEVAMTNKMIYDEELKKETPVEGNQVNHEALIRSIDLILPNSVSENFYKKSKKAIREFYADKPEHAKEILNLVHYELVEEESYPERLSRYLRHFYYHWMPLAYLEDVINKKENSE